jgi:hypothetical protein
MCTLQFGGDVQGRRIGSNCFVGAKDCFELGSWQSGSSRLVSQLAQVMVWSDCGEKRRNAVEKPRIALPSKCCA